jgi:hypothetical protein
MKQLDFFKIFSKKMQDAPPLPDFSGEDWQSLQSRLDAHERKRWRVLPLGWLAGLTGLLLVSNLSWLWLWQKTGDEVSGLHTQLLQCGNTRRTERDTIYEKHIVYQYDTIFKTVVLTRSEPIAQGRSAAAKEAGGLPFLSQGVSGEISKQSQQQGQNASTRQPNAVGADSASAQTLSSIFTENTTSLLAPDLLPCLEMPLFPVDLRLPIMPPYDDIMMPAKQGATAFPLIPRSFVLGLGIGEPTPEADKLQSDGGLMVALTGEIGFSDHLSMVLEGSVGRVRFKGFAEDAALGLPALTPPSDDYQLRYFETNFEAKPFGQLGIGMRWTPWTKGRLNPWLGAGWTMQWNPSYDLEVVYTHLPTGTEVSEEVTVPTTAKPLNYLGVNFGLSYRLMNKWHLQLGFNYDFKTSNQAAIGGWWNWRGGVTYRS